MHGREEDVDATLVDGITILLSSKKMNIYVGIDQHLQYFVVYKTKKLTAIVLKEGF